ncbi:MAG: hydrolase [Bacteroidales bacterium]
METNTKSEPECCPPFDPQPWDDKLIIWENKQFIKDHVFTIFYMPLNFGAAMKRLMKKLDDSGATCPFGLCLSDHTSKWNMDLLLEVDREIPGTENLSLTGKFYSRVYEGNFNQTGNWQKDFDSAVRLKGFNMKKTYMWYTTCPKCAKKYGKNYVVILGQVE